MFFNEIYGVYYQTLAAILKQACKKPITTSQIQQIIRQHAFLESGLTIEQALKDQTWPFLLPDGRALMDKVPQTPLTNLQKSWLKAILQDPRIRLFFTDELASLDLSGVEPLFSQEALDYFDRYQDGDDYTNPEYIAHFRLILSAITLRQPLKVKLHNSYGKVIRRVFVPQFLEYSEKEDKFRVYCRTEKQGFYLNVGRLLTREVFDGELTIQKLKAKKSLVTIKITDERNALNRVLLHFAHFEKQVTRIDDQTYYMNVYYSPKDKTELLIRVLSFGPFVEVVAPEDFRQQLITRLSQQKRFDLF